jgi:DNA polymerase V
VGFAPTKTLAKVANKIAKKFPNETGSSYVIDNDEKRIKALKWLPIGDVWGIGRQHAKRLEQFKIKTAFDFTQLQPDWIKKHMSIVGLRMFKELNGIPCLELDSPSTKQTYCHNKEL